MKCNSQAHVHTIAAFMFLRASWMLKKILVSAPYSVRMLRVFTLQKQPLWSGIKCLSGWEHRSADERSPVTGSSRSTWPPWVVMGNLLESIISTLFHFNEEFIWAFFFSLHCPHLIAEGRWQTLHNHTYPGEIRMQLLLLATAWNGSWCEMAFCMHFHSNVRLYSCTHLPLGKSVFMWPGPFLYSYFSLLDKESEGEESQSEDRLGHYKTHGNDF